MWFAISSPYAYAIVLPNRDFLKGFAG